ncbi:MAG: hypothetical protein WA828_03710 [Coleofasciculaceae cyanobacterium]
MERNDNFGKEAVAYQRTIRQRRREAIAFHSEQDFATTWQQ